MICCWYVALVRGYSHITSAADCYCTLHDCAHCIILHLAHWVLLRLAKFALSTERIVFSRLNIWVRKFVKYYSCFFIIIEYEYEYYLGSEISPDTNIIRSPYLIEFEYEYLNNTEYE